MTMLPMLLEPNQQGEICIPTETMAKTGLGSHPALDFYTGKNTALLLPRRMTAMELIHAIEFSHDMAVNLSVLLIDACGNCLHCGRCQEVNPPVLPAGSAFRVILDACQLSGGCVAGLERLIEDNPLVYDSAGPEEVSEHP